MGNRQRRVPAPPGGHLCYFVTLMPGDDFLEAFLGLAFDLTNALARHAEFFANLLEGKDTPALEAEAVDDSVASIRQIPQGQADEP
jgi:hypothetical protein